MGEAKHTAEQIIAAIRGTSGIKSTIARKLGVHRNSVDNYLARYTSAQAAYDEEVEKVGDIAESLIVDDMVRNRSVETAKWYAKAKLKHRGYTDKLDTEVRGEQTLRVIYGDERTNDTAAETT
jgi:hypothetical protein